MPGDILDRAIGVTSEFTWGDDINSSQANFNWDGNYNTGSDFKQTRDIGQYAPNYWGFFDMHGNVWEWTSDWYRADYQNEPPIDPQGPSSGIKKVCRGGSWPDGLSGQTAPSLRSAKRNSLVGPDFADFSLGFRLALVRIP